MRNGILITLATAFALAPALAAAQSRDGSPSYGYAELGYAELGLDGGGSLGGFGLRGSFALSESAHLVADYVRLSEGPLTLGTTTLAAGFNMPVAATTDVVARVGFVNARADLTGFGDADDNGWMAQGGIRSMLTPAFEVNAFLTYTDVAGADTSVGIGAAYHFTDAFGAFGNVDFADGDSLAVVGIRFSF